MPGRLARHFNPVLFASAALLCASFAACRGGGGGGAGEGRGLVVIARPLAVETDTVHFTLAGQGMVGESMGGVGAVEGEDPYRSASLELGPVPEGSKTARALGYRLASTVDPDPDAFSVDRVFVSTETGTRTEYVVSRKVQEIVITMSTVSSESPGATFGLQQYLLDSQYLFDRYAAWAGSFDGANVSEVIVDAAAPGEKYTIDILPGTDGSGVGLFARLPDVDTAYEEWPDPAAWSTKLDVTTDDNGDAIAYLVARPGAGPVSAALRLLDKDGSIVSLLWFRISGKAYVTVKGQ